MDDKTGGMALAVVDDALEVHRAVLLAQRLQPAQRDGAVVHRVRHQLVQILPDLLGDGVKGGRSLFVCRLIVRLEPLAVAVREQLEEALSQQLVLWIALQRGQSVIAVQEGPVHRSGSLVQLYPDHAKGEGGLLSNIATEYIASFVFDSLLNDPCFCASYTVI